MPAFLNLKDLPGESSDQDHQGWIRFESMSTMISRTIPFGAKDNERTRGETALGEVSIYRQMDKSSVPLAAACSAGTFYKDAEIHFCATFGSKQVPYLKYKLQNVLIISYTFGGSGDGKNLPSEQISLAYTKVEWDYIILSPDDGSSMGNIPGKYEPASGKN